MKNKRVNLTLNPKFHDALAKKADERAMNVTEYIYDVLRDKVFAAPPTTAKKNGAGKRKSSGDLYMDMFTRNR